MKHLILVLVGCVVGGFGMHYYDDAAFAKRTNAHIDAAVAQGAATAHAALEKAAK